MKLDEAITYIVTKATEDGYSAGQIMEIAMDIRDLLYSLEECNKESLDILYKELF